MQPDFLLRLIALMHLLISSSKSILTVNLNMDRYCFLWHNEKKIIFSYKENVYVAELDRLELNTSYFKIVEWPATLEGARKLTIKRSNCYPIVSVLNVKANLFEICGYMQSLIQCHLYVDHGNNWKWIAKRYMAQSRDMDYFKQDYNDGHLLQLSTGPNGYHPVLRLQSLLPNIDYQINSNPWSIDNFPDNLNYSTLGWWTKPVKTGNQNAEQFTPGIGFQFKAIVVAAGRRYVLFNEMATERQEKETFWSPEKDKTTYARIARVCVGDPGMRMPDNGRSYLTSFFKTRLRCQLPVQQNHPEIEQPIRFNHLVTATQLRPSNRQGSDSFIFTLMSTTTVTSWSRYNVHVPFALCVYRLSDIDRTFHSSDLIKLSGSHRQTGSGVEQSESALAYRRILRIHDRLLSTITDCPGPSWPNIRLALEAPLLADAVESYPLALVEIKSRITFMTVDPRSIPLGANGSTAIIYVGTELGEVFQLRIKPRSESMLQIPAIDPICITKLLQLPSRQPIEQILLIGNKSKTPRIVSSSETENVMQLLVMDGRHMSVINISTDDECPEMTNDHSLASDRSAIVELEEKNTSGCPAPQAREPAQDLSNTTSQKLKSPSTITTHTSDSYFIMSATLVWFLSVTTCAAFVAGILTTWFVKRAIRKKHLSFGQTTHSQIGTKAISNALYDPSYLTNEPSSFECSYRSECYPNSEHCSLSFEQPIITAQSFSTLPLVHKPVGLISTICLNNDLKVTLPGSITQIEQRAG